MKPLAPDIGVLLTASWKSLWPSLRSWLGWLIVLSLVLCAAGAGLFFGGPPAGAKHGESLPPQNLPLFVTSIIVLYVAAIAMAVFAIASAVRTVRPDFRMTAGKLLGFIGYGLLAGLTIMAGFLLLVIPGLFLAVKLYAVPYLYLMGEPEPFKRSWEMTKDRFWMTVLMFFVIGLCVQAALYAAFAVIFVVSIVTIVAGLAFIPLLLAAYFGAVQFQTNAYVRWADELLATAPQNSVS